jgi:vacuolar protein sorting-associated protein 29
VDSPRLFCLDRKADIGSRTYHKRHGILTWLDSLALPHAFTSLLTHVL